MISATDRAQIYSPTRRAFLFIDHAQADVGREDRCYQWRAPATAGQRWARDSAERFINESVPDGSEWLQEQFDGCVVVQAPICACCGDVAFRELACVIPNLDPALRSYRCEKHRDRNPCIVEGCGRTSAANGHHSDDVYICAEHWRRYVPPGSLERRTRQRLFRLAKKAGHKPNERWGDDLERRYWILWEGIVRRVRAKSTVGHIDEAAIAKMFGWDEP